MTRTSGQYGFSLGPWLQFGGTGQLGIRDVAEIWFSLIVASFKGTPELKCSHLSGFAVTWIWRCSFSINVYKHRKHTRGIELNIWVEIKCILLGDILLAKMCLSVKTAKKKKWSWDEKLFKKLILGPRLFEVWQVTVNWIIGNIANRFFLKKNHTPTCHKRAVVKHHKEPWG